MVSFCRSSAWLGYTIISVDIFTGKERTHTDTHSSKWKEKKERNERKLGKGKKNNKNNNNNQNNGIIKI